MRTALVFGSTGQIGTVVSRRLLAAGWRVHAVSQSGRALPQDLLRFGALPLDGRGRSREAILGEIGTVDAVVDPLAYDEADGRALAAMAPRCGAVAVLSSASVYADEAGRTLDEAQQNGFPDFSRPRREDDGTVAPGPQTYSTRKVAMERVLLDAPVAATILRPCAIHGPHGRHPREWWFLKRGLDGRSAIPVAFDAESLFHTTAASSLAALVELCLGEPRTRVLNAGDSAPIPVGGLAAAIAAATGIALPLAPFVGPPAQGHVGRTPWSVERPFTIDSAAAMALGWTPEPYADTVGETCRWVLDVAARDDWREHFTVFAQYGYDPFDYAAEDRFLKLRG